MAGRGDDLRGQDPRRQGAVAAGAAARPRTGPGAPAERLARLLVDAAVYPPGHARVAHAVAAVLEAVRAPERAAAGFAVEVRDGELLVEGAPLAIRNPATERLRTDLENLGAERLEILPGACEDDLLRVARFLRSLALRPTSARFAEADLSDLPATVRIRVHRFGVPSFDATGAAETGEAGGGTCLPAASASSSVPPPQYAAPHDGREEGFRLATQAAEHEAQARPAAVVDAEDDDELRSAIDAFAEGSTALDRDSEAAPDAPESINADAYAAWLFRIKPSNPAELDSLLDAEAYAATF